MNTRSRKRKLSFRYSESIQDYNYFIRLTKTNIHFKLLVYLNEIYKNLDERILSYSIPRSSGVFINSSKSMINLLEKTKAWYIENKEAEHGI